MNPDLNKLAVYPFTRLHQLLDPIHPPSGQPVIALSVGEPRHAPPAFIASALAGALDSLNTYPRTPGTDSFRAAAAAWLTRRYDLAPDAVDPATMVLPVNGTREGLYSIAQAVVDRGRDPVVIVPNPLYQIYEGAAVMAGARPYYLDWPGDSTDPDLDAVPDDVWRRCQLVYTCSPGNPTGQVLGTDYLARLIALADRHDFLIAADECYADIYPGDHRPTGLLQTCAALGRTGFDRCLVFHSLSKRSSVPGLRSGFVAGDPQVLARYLLYRTYHGCAMPVHVEQASIAAWNDDDHARRNRRDYDEKFARVLPILNTVMSVDRPAGAFYLWPKTPVDDETFARELYRREGVIVLPGSYVGRDSANGSCGRNPGRNRVRMSLVAEPHACESAARRIARFVASTAPAG